MTRVTLFLSIILLITCGFTCEERTAVALRVPLQSCNSKFRANWPVRQKVGDWEIDSFDSKDECPGRVVLFDKTKFLQAPDNYGAHFQYIDENEVCYFKIAADYDRRRPTGAEDTVKEFRRLVPMLLKYMEIEPKEDFEVIKDLKTYKDIQEWCDSKK